MYIDSHAHLTASEFRDDLDAVIERARSAGVEYIITVGEDIADSRRAIRIAETYDSVYAAVGVHPHEAQKASQHYLTELESMLRHPKVVAVGEIGLDFYRDYSPPAAQKKIFLEQLHLAVANSKPVVVHTRNAWQEILAIVEGEFKGRLQGVFHCFSGDEAIADRLLQLGFSISFTGVVTFKNSQALQIVKHVPLDRLLLETDCPYMAPVPYRGNRNEPAYIPFIAQKIAEAKAVDEKIVAAQTTINAKQLFEME